MPELSHEGFVPGMIGLCPSYNIRKHLTMSKLTRHMLQKQVDVLMLWFIKSPTMNYMFLILQIYRNKKEGKSQKVFFSEEIQVHVGMEPSKTNQTRWD